MKLTRIKLVSRESCSTHAPWETIIGLNLDHHDTCLFTKSIGGEGLPELTKFIHETLVEAKDRVRVRLEGRKSILDTLNKQY